MRAVEVSRHGGPEVLELVERDDPTLGDGELLVEVAAAGVNFIDTYQRSGAYPTEPPFVLGMEGAGRVTAVGSDVGGSDGVGARPGDRVAWCDVPGSYADRAIVPAERAVPVPDGIDDEVAAAGLLQGMTAQYLLHDTYPVRPGDAVLVHAAAGGMGSLLTQWATALGARVIATVSTEEKEKLARAAGAAEVIRYTEVEDVAAEVRRLTGDAGVAAVYDGVGRDTFEASLSSLRLRGMMVLYGASSGAVPPVDPQRLNAGGSLYLTRPKLFDHVITRHELTDRASAVFASIADATLKIRIGHRYPLGDARKAHEDLQARRTTGKLLLVP